MPLPPVRGKTSPCRAGRNNLMKKALLALAVALLVLAGIFMVKKYAEDSASRPLLAFPEMSVDSVVRLHIEYYGDSVTLVRVGGQWMTAGDRFPADTARLRRVLGHLLALQNREHVSRAATGRSEDLDLAGFGLDSTRARRVTWTLADGRTANVLLGKVSGIDFGSSFWKPADEAVVYRTPGTFVFEVSSRSQDWKDINLFRPFALRDIHSVAVRWRDSVGHSHHFTLARDGSDTGFVLLSDEDTRVPARRDESARLFTHATQFKVDEFVGGVDTSVSHARLENPVMIVRVTLQDGTAHVIEAGSSVDGLYRYIRHPTHKDPVRVFGWRFEYFRKTGKELMGP